MKLWEARTQAVRVKVEEKHSEWSKVDQGVRQGCTLLPWLFNVCTLIEVV